MTETVSDWLDRRRPAAPEELDRRLRPHVAGSAPPLEALVSATESALGAVLGAPDSRERAAAYELLAADALLTYACEAAIEGAHPEAALEGVLEHLGRMGGEG